jgi:hypothetical protein
MNMDWKAVILQMAANPGDCIVFSLSSQKEERVGVRRLL